MARGPEIKAKVIEALINGASYHEISKKFGVSRSTAFGWFQKSQDELNRAEADEKKELAKTRRGQNDKMAGVTIEARRRQFTERFFSLVENTFEMLESWVAVCSDPEFIRSNPIEVNELGRTVLERSDRLVAILVRSRAEPPDGEFLEETSEV